METASDPLAWRHHVPALAAAAAGIRRASDAWDAVSDSFCDDVGWPIDEKGYEAGKVARDAEAWKHVEVFLDHGPEVLAGVRAAARDADYAEGPISNGLRRLRGIDTTLERAGRLHEEWEQVMALMDASQPGSRGLYGDEARKIRNGEGWHYADELSYQGAALAQAADYLVTRADQDRSAPPDRAQAARARSTTGTRPVSPTIPPAPPTAPPAAPRRTR
ncbi:hypothetical protein ACGH2B_25065 [Streptomyces sp. BBFR2]|uniref:hypothetical protein n=1 Tax=Streptomyces sp. BBFR2 TaxID=3372854 RepID=UPI0037DA68C6